MAILETINLTKSYRLGDSEIPVLRDINLRINEGEMVAFTGSSGSGKSTLMNILGCLDRPNSGSYRIAGEDVAGLSDDQLATIRNRYIGFVFQTFNLLPRMSALENVELPLMYAGLDDARHRAAEALEKVGLGERMHHEPNQLSGGQRQRVAIARALVTEPSVILADEPTGNLDSRTSVEIMDMFLALHREGKTIVIVTHEPDIANYCSRQIRMMDGRIVDLPAGKH